MPTPVNPVRNRMIQRVSPVRQRGVLRVNPSRAGATDDRVVPGQEEFTTVGTHAFIVPADVRRISGVAVASGAGGRNVDPYHGGGAGGLHWRNDIVVTPGEELTVVVPAGGVIAGVGESSFGAAAYLRRGASEYLLYASGGRMIPTEPPDLSGGRPATEIVTPGGGLLPGGGGQGGDGGESTAGAGGAGGGGAPGYMGDGGDGADPNGTGSSVAGGNAETNGGGGDGGGSLASSNPAGVGLQGRTPGFAEGSLGATKVGQGGNAGVVGTKGGLRIIWGSGRSYPDNAADV